MSTLLGKAQIDEWSARLVTVSMANKTARIVWAMLARKESYRSPVPA